MTTKEMVKRIHENSVKHGFWEPPNNEFSVKLELIHSELSEATEEFRLKPADRGSDDLATILYERCETRERFQRFTAGGDGSRDHCSRADTGPCYKPKEDHKPVGFLVELADAQIRICDSLGRLDKDIQHYVLPFGDPSKPIPDQILLTRRELDLAYSMGPMDMHVPLSRAFWRIETLAWNVLKAGPSYAPSYGGLDTGIPTMASIRELKMAYNETRPYMHGKTA